MSMTPDLAAQFRDHRLVRVLDKQNGVRVADGEGMDRLRPRGQRDFLFQTQAVRLSKIDGHQSHRDSWRKRYPREFQR